MYKPYVYFLTFIHPETQEKLYYIGCRYSNSKYNGIANPNDFWKTYFTSSTKVQSLREQFGNEAFRFSIRKTFTTKKQCLDYEQKLLTKLNAKKRAEFLNDSNGGYTYYTNTISEETKKKMSLAKIGKKFSDEHRNNLKKNHRGRTGVKASNKTKQLMSQANVGSNNPMHDKKHSPEALAKISAASKAMWEKRRLLKTNQG